MKKKFSLVAYLLVMAMLVLPMSGCNNDDDDESTSSKKNSTNSSSVLVISSDAFVEGGEYNVFTGNHELTTGDGKISPKYYVAPSKSEKPVVLQLEFNNTMNDSTGFVITEAGKTDVIFAYNPEGTDSDVETESVGATPGASNRKSYTSLDLSAAVKTSSVKAGVIELDTDDEYVIELSGTGAKVSGKTTANLSAQDYVWHISPDHKGEYWTFGDTEYTENEVLSKVTSADGIYIARDIRYVPDYLEFDESATAKKAIDDSEEMYVAYYNTDAVEVADKYIIAALPKEMGAGAPGGPGGVPPTKPAAITNFDEIVEAMTHSESDAFSNPVLHITRPGTYRLKGTWNGQIWIDIPDKSVTSKLKTKKDPKAQIALILDNVTVKCTVAPALVFKKVYECADDIGLGDSSSVSASDAWKTLSEKIFDSAGYNTAGATVVIAKGTTNTFTGTNVARINDVELNADDGYTATQVGTYVKAQGKLYKLDGAFHSRMTMMIGLIDGATNGTLTINSDYEGLDSEMHMLIDSGTINVKADDDGINVNEDNVSIFDMEGGTLTISSSGGDGIDSNGYVVISGDSVVTINAGTSKQNSAGEAGIDAEKSVYIADTAQYNWSEAAAIEGDGDTYIPTEDKGTSKPKATPKAHSIKNSDGEEVASITFNSTTVQKATYTAKERMEKGSVKESGEIFKVYGTVNNFSGLE